MSKNEKEFEIMEKELGGVGVRLLEMEETSDNDIVEMLNQIDKRKCRFGVDVKKLEVEQEKLINILKNRGYELKVEDVN